MSKGRTAYQILRDYFRPDVPVEKQFCNPLDARIGAHARISNMDGFDDRLWKLTEIWAWDRRINGNSHPMTDYVLESDGKWIIVRSLQERLVLLSQYWPEWDGPCPWGSESEPVLNGVNDATGEFVRFGGTPEEERYFRDLCGILSDVSIVSDKNKDGKVELSEVEKVPYTLWTFRRTTNDIAGQEFEQHLHVQLSGKFHGVADIRGGDKTILILRGEELSPLNLMIY